MKWLVASLLLMVAGTAAGVVFTRRPERQVLAIAVHGICLAVLFMVLQAPDVAFSEIAVGGAALPLMFLAVLASTRMDRSPRKKASQ